MLVNLGEAENDIVVLTGRGVLVISDVLHTGVYRNRMIVGKLADQQLVMISHAPARSAIAAATARAHTALGPPATAHAAGRFGRRVCCRSG